MKLKKLTQQRFLSTKIYYLLKVILMCPLALFSQDYHVDFNSNLVGVSSSDVIKTELNGDSKMDIAFYNASTKTFTFRQNNTVSGSGVVSFDAPITMTLGSSESFISLEDFDGDLIADLIILKNVGGVLEINVKNGPSFSQTTTFTTSLSISNNYKIYSFNMDNQGPKDFYAIWNISTTNTGLSYIKNDGASTNTINYTLSTGGNAQFFKLNYSDPVKEQILYYEKFNNSCPSNSNANLYEIKIFDPNNSNLEVWNLTSLNSNSPYCGTGNWKLIPYHFTGDAYSDVAVYVPEDGQIYMLNNLTGSIGSFSSWQSGLSTPPGSEFLLDAGDYLQTNTNFSDVLLFQTTSQSPNYLGAVYVSKNNLANGFQLSIQMSQSGCYGNPVTTSGGNWQILNGDFNGDGILDISVYQNSNLLSFGLIDVINTTDPLNGYCWPQSADPGGDIKFYYSGQGNPVMKIYQYESRDNTVIETFKDDIIITPSISSSNQDVVTMGCGWTNTVTYTIPSTWESGYYAACLEDEYCKKKYVTFLVKSGSSISNKKVALIANTNTWAAYNAYNVGSSQKGTKYENNTNQSYSFMRPNDVSNPMAQITNRTRAELWIYTWLKDNGYDPDVIADMDVHLNTNNFLNQYDFLIMGTHPEYWTGAMYGHVQAFQENGNNGNGGHLICLGGNAVFEACDINLIDPSNPKLIAYPNSPGGATEQLNAQYPLTDMPNVGGVAGPTNIVTTVYDRFDFFLESYNFGSNQTPVYKRSSDLIGTHYNIINNIIKDNGVTVNTTTSYNLDLTNPAISFLTNGISNNIIGDFGYNTGQFIVADGSGKASGWECERYSNATPPNIPGLNTPASPQPVTSIYDGFVEIVATGTTNNFTAPRLNFPNGLNYSEIIYVPQKCTSQKRGFVFTAGSITFGGSLVWNYNPTTQTYDNDVSKLLLNVLNHRTLQLVSANQPNCVNTATGSIEIQMGVTTPGINYDISPIVGNQFSPGHFSSLPAGAYQITATDANGCTLTTSVTLTDPPALTWTSIQASNPTCANSQTGSINVSASGGTGTINYSINSPSGQFINLLAGTYIVTATDANGCTLTSSITLTDPPSLNWNSIQATNPSCSPGNDGQIIPLTTGGTGQVSFTPSVLTGFNAGTYPITATDANGCSVSTSVTLYQPNTNHCCSATSNPNAGSNIASQPNIILLPNSQVANLTSVNLLNNYGSNGVIQGKKFYIDGILTIDDDLTLDACDIWFTPFSQIIVQGGHTLNLNNTNLSASCDWWVGIEVQQAQNKVSSTGGSINRAIVGIHASQDAIVELDGTTWNEIGQAGIIFATMNTTSYTGYVKNCQFISTGLQPNSITSQHGILIRDAVHLNLGNTNAGNRFDGVRCGISINNSAPINSTIGLYDNTFENIHAPIYQTNLSTQEQEIVNHTYLDDQGTAIFANFNITQNAMLQTNSLFVDHLGTPAQNMVQCDRGIVTIGSNTQITNQKLDNCLLGIMCHSPFKRKYYLQKNKIENAHMGIELFGNHDFSMVNNNDISLSTQVLSQVGPVSITPPVGVKHWRGLYISQPLIKYGINNNTINIKTITGVGILNSLGDVQNQTKGNTISFSSNSTASSQGHKLRTLIGVWADKCIESDFDDNNTHGFNNPTLYDARNSYGMYMDNSPWCRWSCNKANYIRYGFYIWGNNETKKEKVTHNRMDFNEFPWYFLDGAAAQAGTFGTIGNPNAGGIEPANEYFNVAGIGSLNFNPNLYKVYRNSTLITPYQIATDNSFLLQGESGALGANAEYGVGPNLNSYSNPCTNFNIGNPNNGGDDGTYDEYMQDVVDDSIAYINYDEVASWMDRYKVYRQLDIDSLLRSSDVALESFYNLHAMQNIGKLRDAERAINLLYDSTTNASNLTDRYNAALLANESMLSGEDWEMNEKAINHALILLSIMPADSLPQNVKDDIGTIAHLCPYVGGNGVLKARNLWMHWQPNALWDDRVLCMPGQNKNQNNSDIDIDSMYVITIKEMMVNYTNTNVLNNNIKPISSNKLKDPIQLYPNPASNYVEISYTSKLDGEFVLYNTIGDVILKASLPKEYVKRKIQLNDIVSGLYHYEIHFLDGDKQFGKLSIVR